VCLPSPDVAIKLRDREDIEAVELDVPIRTLADVIGQHAFAVIVRWWLCELARTRDVTASHVEPIPLHPPLRNVRHGWPPFCQENCSASCRQCPPGRCERGRLPLSAASHRFVCIIVAYCPIGKSTESGIPCLSSAEDIEWLRRKSCGNVPHRTV
jgi:hypothetical protein